MAYSKIYTNANIFISYAHLDNQTAFHEGKGWIEKFYEELRLSLAQRLGSIDAVKIWWDERKLDGSVYFDESIAESIKQSAIMLCLVSPGYLESEYCQKELELFYNKAHHDHPGLKVGDRSRLLNVLLYKIPHKHWPPELEGTTGFPFYEADTEETEEDWGAPQDVKDPRFRELIYHLRDAIVNIIQRIQKYIDQPPPPPTFSIYFGEVADSLRPLRKRTIAELEKQGYKIIWDVPPPFEKAQHEKAVKEKIEESCLNVHLLDQYPGREIEGEQMVWYPQKQVELGLLSEKPQLIWVPTGTDIEVIEEEQYKTFIQELEIGKQWSKKIDFIRGEKSELTYQIMGLVEQLKKEQEQLNEKKLDAVTDTAVLLDTHWSDQPYAWKVGQALLDNGIKAYINPVEDDPRLNANTLEERISLVNKLIFFYGKVTWDWVKGRMTAALQSIVSNVYPVEEFIVFMVPPHKDPKDISLKQWVLKVNVIDESNTQQLDPKSLQQFIKSIKKQTA